VIVAAHAPTEVTEQLVMRVRSSLIGLHGDPLEALRTKELCEDILEDIDATAEMIESLLRCPLAAVGSGKQQKHTNWHSLSFYGDLSSVAAAYDKGDNLFVEGSVEQRQFAPKSDGVKRTVHEIIVRSFHLIAPPRASNGKSVPLDSAVPERENPEEEPVPLPERDDDPWPVR